jgi:FkbM family methyltransferase
MVAEFDAFMSIRGHATTFLDVGANHGVYSLAFCHGHPESRVLAIEPSPLAFPILVDNVLRNPSFGIDGVQIAGGEREQTLRMRTNWHHLEAVPDGVSEQTAGLARVVCRPLDDVCEDHQFVPDLIKIDVEGFELQCLKGLVQTLLDRRPVVLLEIHPDLINSLGYCQADIIAFVDQVNYHFESLSETRLDPSIVEDQIHTNWVILRPN